MSSRGKWETYWFWLIKYEFFCLLPSFHIHGEKMRMEVKGKIWCCCFFDYFESVDCIDFCVYLPAMSTSAGTYTKVLSHSLFSFSFFRLRYLLLRPAHVINAAFTLFCLWFEWLLIIFSLNFCFECHSKNSRSFVAREWRFFSTN